MRTTATAQRFGLVVAMAALAACGGSTVTLQELQVTPPAVEVTETLRSTVVVTAVFSDGSTQDVTSQVSWSTVDASIAAAVAGVVQAGAPGHTYLVASYGGLESSVHVDVLAATLVSLRAVVDSGSVPAGMTAHVTVLGLFTDGSTRDVTASVEAWEVDDESVEVGDDDEDGEHVVGVHPGVATVTATIGGLTVQIQVVVGQAVPAVLTIAGLPAELEAGEAVPFQVFLTMSDGTSTDVSADVTSEVSDPSVAVLKDVRYGRGRKYLQLLAPGTASLVSRYGDLVATAELRVTADD